MQGQAVRKQKTVRLKGEIDHHSAPIIRKELDKIIGTYRPERLVLDFQDVSMMDSSGIGLVIGRYKKLKEKGASLCVVNVSRQVDAVFRVSGLYQIIKKLK